MMGNFGKFYFYFYNLKSNTVNEADFPLVSLFKRLVSLHNFKRRFLRKELIYLLNKVVSHFDSYNGLAHISIASHPAVQTILIMCDLKSN